MDCSNFAVDVANAFQQVFDVGMVYGAGCFVFGVVFGVLLVVFRRSGPDNRTLEERSW